MQLILSQMRCSIIKLSCFCFVVTFTPSRQSINIIEDDSVFCAEHCIEIRQLHQLYSMEYVRKCTLLDRFLSSSAIGVHSAPLSLGSDDDLGKILECSIAEVENQNCYLWCKLNRSALLACVEDLSDD